MWAAFAGQRIYLDTNIVIHAVEGRHQWIETTREMLDAIDQAQFDAVTSELAIAEVMTKPLAINDYDQITRYQRFFSPNSALKMVPVDRPVLFAAAKLRGEAGFKLADAIHVATARHAVCQYFLTQDERLGRGLDAGLTWLSLSEVAKP